MNGRGDAAHQAHSARQLLARRLNGVLSTVSAEMPGYPFGSVTPYCLDAAGVPLLLLSHLAQHTRNLREEPRAALTILDALDGDVQEAARLTAVGRIEPRADADVVAERYFRYFPQSRFYHEALNFGFYVLTAERWHWNGGFATARWFGNDRLLRPALFDGPTEAAVVADLQSEHRDVLERVVRGAGLEPEGGTGLRVCGVDAEGVDIAVGTRLVRAAFASPVTTAGELLEVLVALAGPGTA